MFPLVIRSRLYGLRQNRQWKDCCFCSPCASKVVWGSVWHLLSCSHPHQVSTALLTLTAMSASWGCSFVEVRAQQRRLQPIKILLVILPCVALDNKTLGVFTSITEWHACCVDVIKYLMFRNNVAWHLVWCELTLVYLCTGSWHIRLQNSFEFLASL